MKKFNHENVVKFADSIYSIDSNGDISYRPLCYGMLAKQESNGNVVGCIMADLFEEFSGRSVFEKTKNGGIAIICNEYYIQNYLISNAELKDNSDNEKRALVNEFYLLQGANDSIRGATKKDLIERAKRVKVKLKLIASTYLN